jgi:hypothetical protein
MIFDFEYRIFDFGFIFYLVRWAVMLSLGEACGLGLCVHTSTTLSTIPFFIVILKIVIMSDSEESAWWCTKRQMLCSSA